MTSLARLIAGGLLLVPAPVGALALVAGPAAASCAEPSAGLLDGTDVAFSGVVTSRRMSGDDMITTVRTSRVFKGDITRRVDVVSPADDAESLITAEDGDRLIVFGTLDGEEVTSSLCLTVVGPGRSYRTISADLGAGTPPAAGYLRAKRPIWGLTYDQFSVGRAILGGLGLSAMGYFVFRAWRARRRRTT